MADVADIANDYMDNEVSRALSKIRQNMAVKVGSKEQKTGTKECGECGEEIPDARRKLGFLLCVECAEETERRKALFAAF